jgi:L-threonylcarbamoyladenylate synthase
MLGSFATGRVDVNVACVSEIERAAELLKQGRLVAFPTETVYGLGADATNPLAIEAIYRTKGRPSTNPLIVHVASVEVARRYAAEWPERAQRLAERFWPGPLTIVLPKRLVIPDNATAGLPTVGLRVPGHPQAMELLRAFDGPLAAPSANRSTRVSPTTARHVREEFPQSEAAGGAAGDEPAMILDGGACDVGIESTVLDLTPPIPVILRPGCVTAAELEAVIGAVRTRSGSVDESTAVASPGQHHVHYAPHTPTYRFETSQRGVITPDGHGIVALSPLRVFEEWGPIVAMPNDPDEYAQHLYAVLRRLDGAGLRAIYVEMPPDRPEWAAVRDRLMRATRPMELA